MAGGDHAHRAEISPRHDDIDALAHGVNVLVGELSFAATRLERARAERKRPIKPSPRCSAT